jgi:glucokinase
MKYNLGIDLGGTKIAAGIVDEHYTIIGRATAPTVFERGFENIVEDIAGTAQKVLEENGLSFSDVGSIGVGVPSSIDSHSGRIIFANNLDWKNVDFLAEFSRYTSVPTFIGNDADCAALAECTAGAARNYSNILMITLGTGVGGGIVINKKIFPGGNGFGCEPGHITIVMDGQLCTCGRKGCLEAYASLYGLMRDTGIAMANDPESQLHDLCGHDSSKVDSRMVFSAAKNGDATALQLVNKFQHYLAVGLSSYATILRPEAIIIGGGLSHQGEYLIGPVRREVLETYYAHDVVPPPAILQAELGNDAGIIGASLLS